MSFARLSASILWSRERTGACTWVWGGTMSAASYQPASRVQLRGLRLVCQFGNRFERDAERVVRMLEAGTCCFGNELRAHARRCVAVREQHRAECDVCRTARDQLECIATVEHTAHVDDRQRRR